MPGIVASIGLTGSAAAFLNNSFDRLLVMTVQNSSNVPSTGSSVLQFLGSGFALHGKSPAARLGFSSFRSTEWVSDSNLHCRLFPGGGLAQSLRVSLDSVVVPKLDIKVSYDAPRISRVTPSVAGDQGGFEITVEGSNFGYPGYTSTVASFEGIASHQLRVVSSTSIVLTTPLFCLSSEPTRNSSILITVNDVSTSSDFQFLFLTSYQGSVVSAHGFNPIRISIADMFSVRVQCFDACSRLNMCDRLIVFLSDTFGVVVRNFSFTKGNSSSSSALSYASAPSNLSLATYQATILILPSTLILSAPIVIDVFPSSAIFLNGDSQISLPLSSSLQVSALSFGVKFIRISSSLTVASAMSITTRDWSVRVVYYNSTNSFGIQSSSGRRLLETGESCVSVCTVVLSLDPLQAIAILLVNGVLTQNASFSASNSSRTNSTVLKIGGSGFSGIPLSASFIPDRSMQGIMSGVQAPDEYVWTMTDIQGNSIPVSQPSNTSCCPPAPLGSVTGNVTIVPVTPVSFKAVLTSVVPSSGPISGGSFVTVSGAGFVNSDLMKCRFIFVSSVSSASVQVTSASFVDSFTTTCNTTQQSYYGVAYVQVSNDGIVWSDRTLSVAFSYLPSVVNLKSINASASTCSNVGGLSYISFWFLVQATSNTDYVPFVRSSSLDVLLKASANNISILLNSTSCGFVGNFAMISVSRWHFLAFNCENPSKPAFTLDSVNCPDSSVQLFAPRVVSNSSLVFYGTDSGILLSSVYIKSSTVSYSWPLFSGGLVSKEASQTGICMMQMISNFSWILTNSPGIIPSVYVSSTMTLSFLSNKAVISGFFFTSMADTLTCVCFKDNGIRPATLHLTAIGSYVDPFTITCNLPLQESGTYNVFVANDILTFSESSCIQFDSCNKAALSANFTKVIFAPELPLITNGSLSTTVTCSGCSKAAITLWLFLSSSSNAQLSTHLIVNSVVRICSINGSESRLFFISLGSGCSLNGASFTQAAAGMWHFIAVEIDNGSNVTSFSMNYYAIQSIRGSVDLSNAIDIVFHADIPQVFSSISLLSSSNVSAPILDRDAISRLRLTGGTIYSSASSLIAFWPAKELSSNSTFVSTVSPADSVLVLSGSFSYFSGSVPFQNPVLSSIATAPDIIPNQVESMITITGSDFGLSPYLTCILSSRQCNINSTLFFLNFSFAACAVEAVFVSRNQILCRVPAAFSQSLIPVYVSNALPGISAASTTLKVMESVIDLDSFDSVSAVNFNSIMTSPSRTFTFWLFHTNTLQERRFFSANFNCSSSTSASFSLTINSNNVVKAYVSRFTAGTEVTSELGFSKSQSLPDQPERPSVMLLRWHFVAVTIHTDGILMYFDNSEYMFSLLNFSGCANITICSSASLESIPSSNMTQSSGRISFSQFRIFDGPFDPAYRGFVEEQSSSVVNYRLSFEKSFEKSLSVSWNFNLCGCSSFAMLNSSNNSAFLTSKKRVSVIFRTVPWLLPQVDSFSPNKGWVPL
jgi:hypothetical protein